MDNNEVLGKNFYSYVGTVIGLFMIGMILEYYGIQLLLPIFILQLIAQGLITYEGYKSGHFKQYVLFMGFIVPFIAATFVGWLNTF